MLTLLLCIALTGLVMIHRLAQPPLRDDTGWTRLHTLAADNDAAGILRAADRYPSFLNAQESGQHTPLHVAVASGHREAVEALLDAGADTSIRDVCGWTALKMAKQYHHPELVELLEKKTGDQTGRP